MKPSRDTRSLCPFSSVGTLTLVMRIEWHRRQFQRLTRTSILRTTLNSHRWRQRFSSTPLEIILLDRLCQTLLIFFTCVLMSQTNLEFPQVRLLDHPPFDLEGSLDLKNAVLGLQPFLPDGSMNASASHAELASG